MTLQQILSPFRRAIEDYKMISEGDCIAIGVSGGKDSLTLLTAFSRLQKFYPKNFSIKAITIDMGLEYDKQEIEKLSKYIEDLNIEYIVEKTDIGKIVFDYRKEQNPCSLCANLRRGALNNTAIKNGCNKVALGHHADDLIETFFLSLMYEGRLSTFSPITHLTRANIDIIRPMIYIKEKDIRSFEENLPVIHNPCPANHVTQREYVKNLISSIRKDIPFVNDNVLNALTHPERTNLFKKPEDDIIDENEKGKN